MSEVRAALRKQLEERGLKVASDTVAPRGELYVMGDNDLAIALFEFKRTAHEAMETMYQGSWIEGLPPRFAVLPADAAADPYFELLEQAGILPLLYALDAGRVTFVELDLSLEVLGR